MASRIAPAEGARPASHGGGDDRWLVYIAGESWEDVEGTNHRLTTALSRHYRILWVDPPLSMLRSGGAVRGRLESIAPRIVRLTTIVPPGSSRRGAQAIADKLLDAGITRALRRLGSGAAAVIVASARGFFPSGVHAPRIYYVTDDWLAGTSMMGLSVRSVSRRFQRNIAAASSVCAVSPYLKEMIERDYSRQTLLIANGCVPLPDVAEEASSTRAAGRPATVGLIGQLNERLDLDVLDRLGASGVPILVVGPRAERDPAVSRRLDAFLGLPNVTWQGRVPYSELPHYLARIDLGLTPYRDNEFNRSSFPLKTLEYLAAGHPVVSADLPSVAWLGTEFVTVARTAEEFVHRTFEGLHSVPGPRERDRILEFARTHSWSSRAEQVAELIAGLSS